MYRSDFSLFCHCDTLRAKKFWRQIFIMAPNTTELLSYYPTHALNASTLSRLVCRNSYNKYVRHMQTIGPSSFFPHNLQLSSDRISHHIIMKLFFALLVMAAAAAAEDAYAGDDANAGDDAYATPTPTPMPTQKQSWGSWFGHTSTNVADSIRDGNFYHPGFVNPALNNPLYHSSARSVLNNLDNFEALYVKYENCAWAQYGQEYSENRDHRGGEDDQDGFEYGEQILGCIAGRGGDEYWYMGSTACFRAQAAFSLYGIPKGQSGRKYGSQCHKATYINSFFTELGFETLVAPLGVDTTNTNSYCTIYPPAYGGEGYYDDDGNDGPGHVEKFDFGDYTSAGIGCKDHRFVKNIYGGASCEGTDHIKVDNTLDSFNEALDNMDCVQIYDSSSGYYYEGDDNGEDDGPDDDEDVPDFTNLDNSVELLKYSIACDVDEYPISCPDPYGLLRK